MPENIIARPPLAGNINNAYRTMTGTHSLEIVKSEQASSAQMVRAVNW